MEDGVGHDGKNDKQSRTAHLMPCELIKEQGQHAGQTRPGIASLTLIKLESFPTNTNAPW